MHRDLKPENIAFDDDLNFKLLDFGMASQKNIDHLTDVVGTLQYMPPEVRKAKSYSGSKADIFSLGAILFTVVTGFPPFEEAKKSDLFFSQLIAGQNDKFFELLQLEHLSPDFKSLISEMLAFEASERPSIDKIRSHPWMREKAITIEITCSESPQKFTKIKKL